MRLLLDTHVWLWMISADERLGDDARRMLLDPQTETYLSVAAVWELAIKHAAGKLRYTGSPSVQVPLHIKRSGVRTLGISVEQALNAAALPMHHRDPFDRLMLAQAADQELTFATADAKLEAYGVPLLGVTS